MAAIRRIELIPSTQASEVAVLAAQCHQFPMSLTSIEGCFGRFYSVSGLYEGHSLVGFYILHTLFEDATIIDICISPDKQGLGCGKMLLNAACTEAKGLGAERLLLEVRQSNDSAIGLYTQRGFIKTATREGYYPCDNGRENAVIMELQLDNKKAP